MHAQIAIRETTHSNEVVVWFGVIRTVAIVSIFMRPWS
jgi:hypothetical protein